MPGTVGRTATRRGLVRLAYPNEDRDEALDELARLISPRVLEVQARLDEKAASEKSFQQAREAAEAVENHLRKVVALVGIAAREDPTGTKPPLTVCQRVARATRRKK